MFNVSINVQCLNAKSLGFSAWNALSNPSSPLLFNSSIQTNQPWSVIASITEGKELFIPFNYADDKHRGWRYHHLAKSSFYKAFSLYIKYIHIYTVYTFVVYDRIWEGCGENWRIDGAVVYNSLLRKYHTIRYCLLSSFLKLHVWPIWTCWVSPFSS